MSLRAFVRAALQEYIRAGVTDCVLSPREVVSKMLHREWGLAGDAFTRRLTREGYLPNVLDDMVKTVWRDMVRLPVPAAFAYVAQDPVVHGAVVCLAAKKPKGLRV